MAWRSRWFKWSQFFFWVYSVYYTPWPGCNNYTVIQMDFGCMRHSGCAEFDAQRPLRGCITQSEGSHLGSFPRESVAGRWPLCTKFAYFSNWNWRPHGCESLGDSKWKKLKKTSNSHTFWTMIRFTFSIVWRFLRCFPAVSLLSVCLDSEWITRNGRIRRARLIRRIRSTGRIA